MRNALQRVSALAFALALAGCASTHGLAPESQPRDANTLATTQSFGASSDAQFPKQDWWPAYGDAQLNELIE